MKIARIVACFQFFISCTNALANLTIYPFPIEGHLQNVLHEKRKWICPTTHDSEEKMWRLKMYRDHYRTQKETNKDISYNALSYTQSETVDTFFKKLEDKLTNFKTLNTLVKIGNDNAIKFRKLLCFLSGIESGNGNCPKMSRTVHSKEMSAIEADISTIKYAKKHPEKYFKNTEYLGPHHELFVKERHQTKSEPLIMGVETSIEDFLHFNKADMERAHDFIQWAFPLVTKSPFNQEACVLGDEVATGITGLSLLQDILVANNDKNANKFLSKLAETITANVSLMFLKMLDFYDINLLFANIKKDAKETYLGAPARLIDNHAYSGFWFLNADQINLKGGEKLSDKYLAVVPRHTFLTDHNAKRLTRIVSSLNDVFGLNLCSKLLGCYLSDTAAQESILLVAAGSSLLDKLIYSLTNYWNPIIVKNWEGFCLRLPNPMKGIYEPVTDAKWRDAYHKMMILLIRAIRLGRSDFFAEGMDELNWILSQMEITVDDLIRYVLDEETDPVGLDKFHFLVQYIYENYAVA